MPAATIEIITQPLTLDIYGFAGIALNKDYAGTAFKLMDRMWKIVKGNNISNKGINIWVYETGEKVFAGVELYEAPDPTVGLERNTITLSMYAYHKHIGSYHLIKQAVEHMTAQIKAAGYEAALPYVEIYGHWTNDESRLETALLMSVK